MPNSEVAKAKDPSVLEPGRIVRISHLIDMMRTTGGCTQAGFQAIKKDDNGTTLPYVFVCVVLGTEPKYVRSDEQTLDIEKAMNELGWYRKPNVKPATQPQ